MGSDYSPEKISELLGLLEPKKKFTRKLIEFSARRLPLSVRKRRTLKTITAQYLTSSGFNGTNVRLFEDDVASIIALLQDGMIDVVRGDGHPNPHIKAMKPYSREKQLRKIEQEGLGQGCIYPSPEHLEKVVDASNYSGRPYALELALGRPSLDFAAFNITALEVYKNDPRFRYDVDDAHGNIEYREEFFDTLKPGEKAELTRFGFGRDSDGNRAIISFYWDLFKMNPEQQAVWKAREIDGDFQMHRVFFTTAILGQFYEGNSIYDAILLEMSFINIYTEELYSEKLFKETFEQDRPRDFAMLLRPTKRQMNEFVMILDKLLSENINTQIFSNIQMTKSAITDDGEKITKSMGSLTGLESWLKKIYSFKHSDSPREILASFRKVRKLRQKPAHKHELDIFDQAYFKQQENLVIEVFRTLNGIRLLLGRHPKIKDSELPEWYDDDNIWLP